LKTWRVLVDGQGTATAPLSAVAIADRLWVTPEKEFLWAEPVGGGDGAFPQDVPEVRLRLLVDPERIAHAWLEHTVRPGWLFLWVMDLCLERPDEAWPVVLALVRAARGDLDLAGVAAGPIEQLLNYHGLRMIDEVEREAAQSSSFRRALSGVWSSEIPQPVWERICAARGPGPGLDA
jgi:hypothetical protein